MIDGKVGFFEDGCHFKLVGGHFVMACLARDAQFESLHFHVAHKGSDAFRDGTEVVVVHLLVLCRVVAHQCAACQQEVGAGRIETLVNEEILLFPSEVAGNFLDAGVEIVANIGGCHIDGMQCSQQRCLIVECLTGIGNKDGGDAQCVVDDGGTDAS